LDRIRKDAGDRRLVLIGTVPGAGGTLSSADCLLRPTIAQFGCSSRMTVAADQTVGFAFNRALAAYASAAGVEYIEPYEAFCARGWCRVVIDGRLLYSDAEHLSKDGSMFAVSQLKLSQIGADSGGRVSR
jgi:hypothetical protein